MSIHDMFGPDGKRLLPPKPKKPPSWIAACQLENNDEPRANLHNAMLGLEQDPDFKDLLFFDQMLCEPVIDHAIEGLNGDASAYPRPVTDNDISAIQRMLQKKGLEKLSAAVTAQAVQHRAHQKRFHPVRIWLKTLQWDGKLRLADWMTAYLGCPADEYYRQIGTMFLIGMVARVLEPGCQCDYMLVLESQHQGILKSTVCRTIAGEWFSDQLPDLHADPIRLSLHLRGKWLIEISELSAFSRADSAVLKSFITRREEKYTPKFGRHDVYEPRQCVFVGTTNKSSYLRDETGGRRYWPAKCGNIDLAGLARNRDQLFAEALDAKNRGCRWWPERDLEDRLFKPQQDSRYQGDAWEKPITDWDFMLPNPKAGDYGEPDRIAANGPPFYLIDIAVGALGFKAERLKRADEVRIMDTLDYLGWSRGKKTLKGRTWLPPVTP